MSNTKLGHYDYKQYMYNNILLVATGTYDADLTTVTTVATGESRHSPTMATVATGAPGT